MTPERWRGGLATGLGAIALSACQTSTVEVAPVPPPPNASVLEAPPPPPPSAFLALLTPEQTAEIRSLGVPLVVPTSIPPGFQVEAVTVDPDDDRAAGYTLLYRDGSDRCFVVEQTKGGVGSIPATENRLPINSPLLAGAEDFGLNYGSYAESAMRQQFPAPELSSDWLPIEEHFYRLAGAAYINQVLAPNRPCADVTPAEALQLVESFAVVTEDITGDK